MTNTEIFNKFLKEQDDKYTTLIKDAQECIEDDIDLFNACVAQEVVDYGMSAGVGSLIYYSDTKAFFDRNIKAIRELLMEEANELGFPIGDMFRKNDYSQKEILDVLYGVNHELYDVKNKMTWAACEIICYRYTTFLEDLQENG